MQLYLVKLTNESILEQLELEEALLRADDRSFCIINCGSTPSCVFGISSKPEEMLYIEEAKNAGVTLIRRFSGGGTVIVDENTIFTTFIINQHHNTDTLHTFAKDIYADVFSPLPFSFHENDYRLNDKKIGGNAQYFTKNRSLHHTSFLFDWSKERMGLLKIPPKMPSYRQNRTHEEFLTPLKHHFATPDSFLEKFENQLRKSFEVIDISVSELKEVFDKPYRKSLYTL